MANYPSLFKAQSRLLSSLQHLALVVSDVSLFRSAEFRDQVTMGICDLVTINADTGEKELR